MSTLISGTRSAPGPPEVAAITASTCNCAHGVRALPSADAAGGSAHRSRRAGWRHGPGRVRDACGACRSSCRSTASRTTVPAARRVRRRHYPVGRPRGGGTGPGTAARTSPHSTSLAASSSRSSWEKNSARSSSSRRRVACGERIDMTRRHRPVRQRVFEPVRGCADPVTFGDRGGVLAGASPGGAEQRLRRRCRPRSSQLAAAAGAPHLEGIQPAA